VKTPSISGKILKFAISKFMFVVYIIVSIILIVLCCRKGNCGGKKVKELAVRIKGRSRKAQAIEEEPPND